MRYKVGDKVRVRDWDDMEREFGTDDYGIKTKVTFVEKMRKFCGKEYMIKKIECNCYKLDGTDYWEFSEDALEDVWIKNKYKIGDRIKIIKATEGSYGANGEVGIMIDEMNTNGLTCKEAGVDAKTENGIIWRIGFKSECELLGSEGKKMKQTKQKTKRERLEEKIVKYKVGSGIDSIKIIASNMVVKIKMDPMFSQWKNEYKMVCDDQDTFSLERAIYLAYAKDECCGKYTSEYIELYADKLAMEKKFVAKVKAAMNLYECQEELKKLDEEEAAMIQRKREKRWKQKERRAERKRNEQIAIQKEAYVRAWREIKKQEEAENVNSVELTEENAEDLSVEE